jgi:dipeptidyl aminopeptidase/acylaminoacyl peptidase
VQGVKWCLVILFTASLAGAATGPARATFPGRNGLIAFSSLRDGNYEIYSMQPDATDQTRLTRNPGADIDPAWSPKGDRLAFTSDRDGNPEIYVAATDGSGVVQLTTSDGANIDPTWSPDGSRIAFSSSRDGNYELYVMNADGSGQTRITTALGNDQNPSWSPDGSVIAFASERTGASAIYTTTPDGTTQRRLTSGPGAAVSPSWSPDGKRIAFASNRDGNYEIYAMDADGSNLTRLTRNLAADIDPAWSPDGKQIAFTSARDVNYEIYAMNADGSSQGRLTTNEVEDTTADWQTIPIPPPVVAAASFQPRWRESAFLGTLEVQGNVATPATAALALKQGDRTRWTRTLVLAAGAFVRNFKLPTTLLPGPYVLDVTPSGSAFSPQQSDLELKAPPEGVVSRAYASTNPGGVPVLRFPPQTTTVFAQFRFAALPHAGRVVTVSWYKPDGRRAGPPVRKPPASLVVSFVSGRADQALPRGTWQSVLRAGRTVVKRLRFRVG